LSSFCGLSEALSFLSVGAAFLLSVFSGLSALSVFSGLS